MTTSIEEQGLPSLVRQFAVDAGLRWAGVARVLDVSNATVSRWLAPDSETVPDPSSVDMVQQRIARLYAADKETGLFHSLHSVSQKDKELALIGVLYKKDL